MTKKAFMDIKKWIDERWRILLEELILKKASEAEKDMTISQNQYHGHVPVITAMGDGQIIATSTAVMQRSVW